MEFPVYVTSIKLGNKFCYMCQICSRMRTHELVEMKYHLVSQEHKKNMERRDEYYCETCQIQCKLSSGYKRHIETKHHKQKTGIEPKIELKCEPCGVKFLCNREQERHLLTKKHAKRTAQS